MNRNIAALLLSVMLALSLTACNTTSATSEPSVEPETSQSEEASSSPDAPGTPPVQPVEEAPLASLGDNVISTTDFLFYYAMYRSNIINSYSQYTDMDTFWTQEYEGKTMKEMLVEDTLDSVKEYAVLYSRAKADGLSMSDEKRKELEEGVENTLNNYLGGDEQAFLEMFAVTPEQLMKVLERGELATSFRGGALEKIEVTEQEISDYYANHKDEMDQVTVRHVLIECLDTMTEEEQAAAKTKAEDILAELKAGADIGALAAEHSTDPGSSQNNGEYTFGRGMMVPEFENWSFEASPGDQGMVKTDYGYHIMQLMGRTGFEDLKTEITSILREEKFPQQYGDIQALVDSPDWDVDSELLGEITKDR